ncbi:MAG: hypothetical protein GX463_06425 [Methanothrix sp.]|nr:hypothetical protein [Methanothrix sp.]
MSAIVVLEWKFSPPDYFESQIEIEQDDYIMTIEDGKVEARIDSAIYEANPLMRDALHKVLNSRFLGVLLYSHKPYRLENPTMARLHDDGRKDYFLMVEPGRYKLTGGRADFQYTNKDGIVVVDTKRDRIEEKKAIADLVSKHVSEDLVLALLRSYEDSVRDPNNELIYLYEIRDALCRRFDNEKAVIDKLGISSNKLKYFRKLCNHEPLMQGRHRGKTYDSLRGATEAELSEARETAKAMIEGYLQYLDTTSNSVYP